MLHLYKIVNVEVLNNKYTHIEIEHLFTRIAEGSETAYKQLFQQYFQRLIDVMMQYTHRKNDAEDIVQAVFLRVWEKRLELREIKKPDNWLFISARNEFLGRFRKLQSENRYRQYLTQVFEAEQEGGNDFLLLQQRDDLIRSAILLLPEKQREAFFLNRYKGLTYEEIAEKMQISRTTVKEHISRALRSIKPFLMEHKNELLPVCVLFSEIFNF